MAIEFAGVIHPVHRGPVGHLVRFDEIAPAEFVRRQAAHPRRLIGQPFNQISRFWPPCPAIGINRHCVGEDIVTPDTVSYTHLTLPTKIV